MRKVSFMLFSSMTVAACVGDSPTNVPDAGSDASQNDAATQDVKVDTDAQTEAGPFDANAYPNLELWLAADVGVTGDGGSVATWTDQSAKHRNVKLPTSDSNCVNAPSLVANAQHGLPMASFDGTFQCLSVGGTFDDFTAGLTAFAVYEPGNCNSSFAGNAGAIFDIASTVSGYAYGILLGRDYAASANTASGDALLLSTNGTGDPSEVQIIGGSSWVPGTPHLVTFHLPSAPADQLVSGTAFVDGTLATLGTNTPLAPGSGNRATTYVGYRSAPTGGYPHYCGMLGELLVYSKALTDPDRQAIEAHLKTRWGL